jgi:polyisoprenyl-phosphate glycosyltransferase
MSASEIVRPRPLLSIVLSFRNEEEVLPELIRRLQQAAAGLPADCEFIFVNDVSTDRSLELLTQAARTDRRVKVVNLSRRFGVVEGFLAGMSYARGGAVVTMDSDLQDPPELIPELVEKWLAGWDVVYTVRLSRAGESRLKTFLTRQAYKLIRLAANEDLPVEAGEFRLITRRVMVEVLKLNENDPYLRGLVWYMGFKRTPVHYHRAARAGGETHFPLLRSKGPLLTFASGLTSFSVLPLVAFVVLGLGLTSLAAVAALALGVMKLLAIAVPGWGWIITALAFFTGLQLMGIGTVGVYVGRAYRDVRNRPRYLVASTVGFEDSAGPDPERT